MTGRSRCVQLRFDGGWYSLDMGQQFRRAAWEHTPHLSRPIRSDGAAGIRFQGDQSAPLQVALDYLISADSC